MARTKKVSVEEDDKGVVPKIKKRKKKSKSSAKYQFSRYIYKVFRSTVPGLSISVKAMSVMQDFTFDLLERLAGDASRLMKSHRTRRTLLASDIKYALKLVVPGELYHYTVHFAEMNMKRYFSKYS